MGGGEGTTVKGNHGQECAQRVFCVSTGLSRGSLRPAEIHPVLMGGTSGYGSFPVSGLNLGTHVCQTTVLSPSHVSSPVFLP